MPHLVRSALLAVAVALLAHAVSAETIVRVGVSQRDLGAIRDRVVMLNPGDDIVTGLRTLDTAGHTPGHISL